MNLFDTRNIRSVYAFTGNAEDDGFLASSLGAEKLESMEEQGVADSYRDYYLMAVENPFMFTKPRRTRVGLVVSF
jgi:hypothetical protein